MKCIILVAGYATRLYPLTRDIPKSLLLVGGKTILDRILEKVERVPALKEVILVSNHRFIDQFKNLCSLKNSRGRGPVYQLLDDGSTDNDTRLGALGDLAFAVKAYDLDEDLLVLAGDNLFEFELTDFVSFYHSHGYDSICAQHMEDPGVLRISGIIELDKDRRVLSFQEKPSDPKTNWAVPPFYIYRNDTIPLLLKYLREGKNPDAPGNFIPWLIKHKAVYAYIFKGARFDIGTIESLREVQQLYEGT